MSFVKAFGCAVYGINATTVTVEVNIDTGINFHIVGLPDSAVKESQQRIDAALKNNGFKIPGKKITINLAPADIRKEGSSYDLPIAVGILCASEQLKSELVSDYIIMGELALDGILRPVRGALPMAIHAKDSGFKGVILPAADPKTTEKWSDKSGNVDKKYLHEMVEDHEDAVKLFEKACKSDDADIAAFAQRTLPTLQHHLQMAKDLKKTL